MIDQPFYHSGLPITSWIVGFLFNNLPPSQIKEWRNVIYSDIPPFTHEWILVGTPFLVDRHTLYSSYKYCKSIKMLTYTCQTYPPLALWIVLWLWKNGCPWIGEKFIWTMTIDNLLKTRALQTTQASVSSLFNCTIYTWWLISGWLTIFRV